ncbi:hypothetical protein [Natronoglycomyces albus]|uniref:DUF8175 domain-containing protein n=1 Tax=Natronoglycomyces albus TaxID=2811108 RepID=A0A895XXF6_9ACTN|nr:hypothetical protein [Natronoglycomyces albus]QSB07186.1 hypothetical protein JQS30_16920 [Natronoglycomyces albus]
MRESNDGQTSGAPRVWAQKSFIASALVVAIALIGGVFVVVGSGGEEDPPAGSAEVPVEGYLPGNEDAVAVEGEPLLEGPQEIDWQLVGSITLPFSSVYGPAVDDGFTASQFERSPEGALMAAVHLSSRAGGYGPEEMWRATIEHQFIDSPERDALLELMEEQAVDVELTAGDLAALAGFVYRSYSPDEAVIEVVLDNRSGGWYSVLTTVRWIEGDWRMEAPPRGDWTAMMRQVPTADQDAVVPWGPSW